MMNTTTSFPRGSSIKTKKKVTQLGKALKLLLKESGWTVNGMETKKVMFRRDWYQLIKTPNPGLITIEKFLKPVGLTWNDWAKAYAEVTKQGEALSKSGQAAIKDLKEALKDIEGMTPGKIESNAYIVYRNRSRAGVDKKTGLPKVLTPKERENLLGT